MTSSKIATAFTTVAVLAGALSLGADDAQAQCAPQVQQLITDHKYDEARAAVQAQLTRAPNDDAAMDCMGRVRLDQGESGEAVEWLEKALAINGKSAQHHFWLGSALRAEAPKANMLRQASLGNRMKTEFEQAVALDPTLIEARHGLVQFYAYAPALMGGGVPKAREQADAILKLNPVRGHLEYAFLAENGKDYAGAAKEYLAAIAAAPANLPPDAARFATTAHLSLGRVYITSLNDYDRGEKEVRFWLANPPKGTAATNVATAHYCLGLVHQQGGRRDQARAEYQAALAANPKHEEAKKALAALK